MSGTSGRLPISEGLLYDPNLPYTNASRTAAVGRYVKLYIAANSGHRAPITDRPVPCEKRSLVSEPTSTFA